MPSSDAYPLNMARPTEYNGISIIEVDGIDGFRSMQTEWEALLRISGADTLYLSWQWQFSWWETWSGGPDLRLLLLKAYRDGELAGIAPLYLDRVRLRGGMCVTRLQFIGNAWRKRPTVRTEYLGFVLPNHGAGEVAAAFLQHLSRHYRWDEFVVCDALRDSISYRQILKLAAASGWQAHEAGIDRGIRVDTVGDFKAYLQSLGKNTRLKLYNRRKRLHELGTVGISRASSEETDSYFDILNAFHRGRWGKECFARPALEFHTRLIGRLGPNQAFDLSCLMIDNEPVSVSYNLRAGDTVYNLQSGFLEDYDSKLSLGTLHMGFCIEKAFEDKNVHAFDMLAGSGKTEFYKQKYRGSPVEFVTLLVTRHSMLKTARALYLAMPAGIKRLVAKAASLLRL